MIAYLLLGETRISGRRRERGREIEREPARARRRSEPASATRSAPAHYGAPFALARTVNRLDPTCGNSARLAADSNVAIDEMVARHRCGASSSVHVCSYIWLADNNGLKVKDACIRAAERGVQVRLLADALGSRRLIRSSHWREMRDERLPRCGSRFRSAIRCGR